MAIKSDNHRGGPAPPEGEVTGRSAGEIGAPEPAGDAGADVDALVAQGDYARAAAAARAGGQAARAAELYERIWEFGLAADCAREAGDLGRALQCAIDARDEARVRDLAQALDDAGADGRRTAMEVFAHKRRFEEAARRAEALGDVDAAVEHYRRAQRDLEAARLLDAQGRDRDAGRLLERFIELAPPGRELARARLHLGLILSRRMNHEAAARHLQEAARHDDTRGPAQRALVVSLAAMGLRDAARDVLVAARRRDPDLPADIDAFLRQERQARRAAAGGEAAGPPDERGERDERAGEQVVGGRYRLESLLGAGSAGRVFAARDEVSGRPCAVKLLHVASARGNQAYERFVREAKLASTLRHPNLIEVYDFSADQGFLVMERMSGSLVERLARGPLGGPGTRRMCLDVLAGLELAHQRGVIHRDIKPANIFFDARGTAKLGDFGVAHLLDLGHTQTGGLIGTLAYMAPEQVTAAPLTMAADLYALGVTLFEALTGRLPFLGPDFVAQHLGETPPAPSSVGADVAPGWDPIIARLLHKSPDERYGSIDELRRDVRDVDLGDADRPTVLMLHRAPGAAVAPADLVEPVAPEEPGGDGGGEAEAEEASRYQYETPMGRTEVSRLSRAVDTVLGRSIIIERYDEGGMDEATERRLYALARGGGPFVQRALAYDRAAGVAVFEAPSGRPLAEAYAEPPGPRRAARLLKRLARAVAPLHHSQTAHGALDGRTILVDEEDIPTVLVCGLGRVDREPTPADDVTAVLGLVLAAMGAPPGREVPAEDLGRAAIAALVPGASADRRAALEALARPGTGEALYAFADAVEVALLETRLGGS